MGKGVLMDLASNVEGLTTWGVKVHHKQNELQMYMNMIMNM
jgi:hypothetical protein